MILTDKQLSFYENEGYLFLPDYFSGDEMSILTSEVLKLRATEKIGKVLEKDGTLVRALHGSNERSILLNNLTRLPRLLDAAVQILKTKVYVYQFKINTKAPFFGDAWPWHQDFIFWHEEDGMPCPQAVNVLIFIDEVTQFNGPLFLIPGSHKEGSILNKPKGQGWEASFSAALKYTVPQENVTDLAKERGLFCPTGSSGSVLFFHPNCVHASANNISPFSRNVIIVTYNSTQNIPLNKENPRPGFLVNQNNQALEPLPEDRLASAEIV